MLYGMAAFVRRNCGCGHTGAVVYIRTQVYGLIHRIVVVAQETIHRGHFYIINPVFPEHFFRDFPARKAAGKAYFKVYRQFKMYNDPRFNPALVAEAASGGGR